MAGGLLGSILGSGGSSGGGGGGGYFGLELGGENKSSTVTSRKKLSQEAIDKLVYDVLSSDQGLSALATAENASGGYGSSSKTLLAQDLIAKITGELANITAETITKTEAKGTSSGAKAGTVICTYLATHGYMPLDLYLRGHGAYLELNPITVRGYHSWGIATVSLIQDKPWLCKLLAKVAIKRYKMLVEKKFSIIGAITIYVAQPICYLIGLCIPEEKVYG
jgi:hypothetical protein